MLYVIVCLVRAVRVFVKPVRGASSDWYDNITLELWSGGWIRRPKVKSATDSPFMALE